jgi:hypothetical protein
MTFETFNKCIDLVRFWRSRTGKYDYQWPDSRDPDLLPLFEECDVVSQDLEKALVALAAWRESDMSVYQAMSSKVHLIRNRESIGMLRSHITDEKQFPAMNSAWSPEQVKYPIKEPEFEKLLGNLDDILQGKTVDITQGSIYFGVVGDSMPEWFTELIHSPDIERTVKIDNVTFYKTKVLNG